MKMNLRVNNGFHKTIGSASLKKKIQELELQDIRVVFFDEAHPCSTLFINDQNFIFHRLYRRIKEEDRRESLRITVPFSDVELCQMGSLNSGTIFSLRLRSRSYKTFLKTFAKNDQEGCSPDNFLQILTKKTIRPSEMRTIENSMKLANANVQVTYGSQKYKSEQILKGQVSIEEVLSAVPDAIHIDDEVNDDQSDDVLRKELINIDERRIIVNDFLTLLPRTYLNDSILDYYLNHIQNNFHKTHSNLQMSIIPAFKAQILIRKSLKNEHLNGSIQKLYNSKQISKCDFLVLPLVHDQHWFMAVITNINKAFKLDYSSNFVSIDKDDRPVVIYFDSFRSYFIEKDRKHFNNMIFAFLKDILRAHIQTEYSDLTNQDITTKIKSFSIELIHFIYPYLPQQTNNHDCGLFLLQFAEKFFQNPVLNTKLLIKNDKSHEKWFNSNRLDITRNFLMKKITQEILPEMKVEFENYLKSKKITIK